MASLNINVWKYSSALSLFCVTLFLVIITWRRHGEYGSLVTQAAVLRTQSAPFSSFQNPYHKLQAHKQQLPHPFTFIKTVKALIPNNARLTTYTYEAHKNILLAGKAKKYTDLIAFTHALQQTPGCQHLSLTHTQQLPSSEFNFTITIPLNEDHGTH